MTAAIYTTDPNRVTSVTWPIASERVQAYDEQTDELIDGPNDDARMQRAKEFMIDCIMVTYPNCADIYVTNGGFENQFASFAPRAETDDDSIYEPFFDDMAGWEDDAIAHAWSIYPD